MQVRNTRWPAAGALALAAATGVQAAVDVPGMNIYVEDFAVRQELFLPIADYRRAAALAPDERDAFKQQSAAAAAARLPLLLGGRPAKPESLRGEWLRLGPDGPVALGTEEVPDGTTILGVSAVYPVEGAVEKVEFQLEGSAWGRSPVNLEQGREVFSSYVTTAQPRFLWEKDEALLRPGQGSGTAQALVRGLLGNVYRAYGLEGEDAVYDRLALSLDGELLENLYLSQRRGRLSRNRGESRVRHVEVLEAAPEPPRDGGHWRVAARWIAEGAVSHWGHSHPRSRQYRAMLGLERRAAGWRIVSLEVAEEAAVEPADS